MHLKSIRLKNFRLYEEAYFEFSPDVNFIFGANAKGKTTILEAVHVLMTGRSFRTNRMSGLIRQEAPFFFLEAAYIKNGIEQSLKFSFDGKERQVFFNASPCHALSDLLGLMQGVVITPDDAELVKGAPAFRRQFLDLQLAQADPLYVHYLTRYQRAMRQRNCLLKAKSQTAIEGFEEEMAKAASYIAFQRKKTVDQLQKLAGKWHESISLQPSDLSLRYETEGADPLAQDATHAYYRDLYAKYRVREMELGITLKGIHKDDLAILLKGNEVRFFGSEGQQRSCVAALKLAEWEILKEKSSEIPLMLIDDLGLSLDASRKARLLDHVTALGQVFLTSAETLAFESEKEIRHIEL